MTECSADSEQEVLPDFTGLLVLRDGIWQLPPEPNLRPPGEMASRLTTNQEIAGSTPAVVIWK